MSDSNNTRQRRLAGGLCQRCGDPTTGKNCAECRAVTRVKMRELYRQRVAAGLCVDCADPIVPGRRRCESCLEAIRFQKKQRDDARLAAAGRAAREVTCGRCGEAGHYRTTCTSDVNLAEVAA